jgi:hypothetical protein
MPDLVPADPAPALSPPAEMAAPDAAADAAAALAHDAQRAASLALLDRLEATWLPKAEAGDPAAAALVLNILKQRAVLLGLAHSPAPSPALRVAASSPAASEDGEIKLVVEYVNDWREVLRRRT